MALLAGYRRELGEQVHELDRDDPRRDLLVAVWGVLGDVEQRMREVLSRPVPEVTGAGLPRRPVGEDTQAWRTGQAYMPRNRGPV
jgi:hypothetical protein